MDARLPTRTNEWTARVERWNGERGIGFLASGGEPACGIVGALLEEDGRARLVSMWIAPEFRRGGLGRMLVDAVIHWAAEHGVPVIRLMVTSPNAGARRFYERLGFERTGRNEPYPNDPVIMEWEMVRRVPDFGATIEE